LTKLFAALGVDDRGDGVVGGLEVFRLDVLDGVELLDDRLGGRVLLVEGAEEGGGGDLADWSMRTASASFFVT
jgi:hypothetical protein